MTSKTAARRLLIVFNPSAGWRRRQRLAPVLAQLREHGCAFVVRETEAPGDAERFAAEVDPGTFDLVVAAGGKRLRFGERLADRRAGHPDVDVAVREPLREGFQHGEAEVAGQEPDPLVLGRQRDEIELIASENIVSRAVLEARAVVGRTPLVVLTGGGARALGTLVRSANLEVPDLVLWGLAVWAREG